MNFTAILGIAIAISIIGLGVIFPSVKPDIFLDKHALLLVFGSTIAVALISYPMKTFGKIFELFTLGFLMKKRKKESHVIWALYLIARFRKTNSHFIENYIETHEFLQEAYVLMDKKKFSPQDLYDVLYMRAEAFKKSYTQDAKVLMSMSKYPPAFGLLGASTGMIAMMSNLGTGGMSLIGPAMAIALVATFWGIALANYILLPLTDYAFKIVAEDSDIRQLIVKGIIMMKLDEDPEMLLEKLISYVSIDARCEVLEFLMQKKEELDRPQLKDAV